MYANIVDGVVNLIKIADEDVQSLRDSGLTLININSMNPKPETGWAYNSETEEFIAPVVEEEEDTNNYLYIHLTMTDGDDREPIGIKNDNTDSLSVIATFRQTSDPSSAVIASITGMSWRVTIRNVNMQVYDIVDVTFTDGVASFSYTTDNKPDICKIIESDFENIQVGETTYVLKLIGNSTFKVYRQL